MRNYILTKDEEAHARAYLAGGEYDKATRKLVSQWRESYQVLLQDIKLLKELEAKRR